MKLLNIVLAGQPELADRLNEPSLRQLKQRISLRCELTVLDLGETAAYVAGRLRIAGGLPAHVFTQESVVAIYQATGGLPRTINVLCDNALICGFAAQVKPITVGIVEEVSREFQLQGTVAANSDGAYRGKPRGPSIRTLVSDPRRGMEKAAGPSATIGVAEAELFEAFRRKRRFSFF